MGKFKTKKDSSIFNPEDLFKEAIIGMRKEQMGASGKTADVITFAKEILGVKLYPAQEIILKFFYKNSRFNEDIEITEADIEAMSKWSIEQSWILYGENSKIKAVNEKKKIAKDLVLVLGRRSGKSFLSSLISVYEAYRLLELKDPQKFYGIDSDIYIINTAVTKEQALSQIFKQMSKFINRCPYFSGRVCKETEGKIVLYTEADLERIKLMGGDGTGKSVEGSVVILSGTSNSPALRGHTASVIIFDEMAHYVNTDGTSSAKEVYNALSRSTLTLAPKGDGRNVVISSPDKRQGFFYDHYESGKEIDTVQVFQIPTIDANPNYTGGELQDEYLKDPITAASEFGALFRTVGGDSFFPPDKIDEAMKKRPGMHLSKKGVRGYEYYMHIDPATSSDNWALVIVHPEWRYSNKLKVKEQIIVEDYSCFWKPPVGGHLDENEIMDDHILPLCKTFNFVSVTYDNMFSLPQRHKLNQRRIPNMNISFSGRNKNNMYSTVKDLLIQGRIELCVDDSQLEGELKAILVDYSGKYPTIMKDRNNDKFPNDDLCFDKCTLVKTIKGFEKISNLKIGDEVLTMEGCYKKIVNVFENTRKSNIMKMKCELFPEVLVTENHPYFVRNKGYLPLSEIEIGDEILYVFDNNEVEKIAPLDMADVCNEYFEKNIKKSSNESMSRYANSMELDDKFILIKNNFGTPKKHKRFINFDNYLFELFGFFASEGAFGNHSINFSFNSKEKEYIERIKFLSNEIFGLSVNFSHKANENSMQVSINSVLVKYLFQRFWGEKCSAGIKEIPPFITNAKKDLQKCFIKSYWEGDGCYSSVHNSFIFTTTSRVMASQIRDILLRFGIISSFQVSKRKGKIFKIREKECKNNYDLINIVIKQSLSFNKLAEILQVGFKKNHSKSRKEKIIENNNSVYIKLKKKEKIEDYNEEFVYNLEVEDNHNYIVENGVVHNCDCLCGVVYRICMGNTGQVRLPRSTAVFTGRR